MQAYREIIDGRKLRHIINLPGELQQAEVEIIVLEVEKSKRKKEKGKLLQDWAGAIRDYKEQYTSLELQKKALEWRGE